MTNKEARDKMIAIKAKLQVVLDMYYKGEEVTDAFDVAIEALEQEPKTDYKAFAEWVATEIFDDMWEYNKDAFAEIACRKLSKLGIVVSEGDLWKLKESEGEE